MVEPPTSSLNRDTAARATAEQVIASLALVAIFGVLWRFETMWKAAAAVGFVVTLAALSIVDVRTPVRVAEAMELKRAVVATIREFVVPGAFEVAKHMFE